MARRATAAVAAFVVNVACVGTGWYPQTPGGLEKYVYGMTHELVRSGDSVDLFLTGEPRSWHVNARVYALADPATSLWDRAVRARRCFIENFREPYDVVNIHFAMNALPLVPFIRHRALRVVHFHGPWAAESRAEGGGRLASFVKSKLERAIYHRADRFITLSGAFKDVLVDGYGIDPARVSVIPMGIDIDAFLPASDRASVRASLGWPSDETIFFTARRLVNRVGLLELLRAAAIVRRTHGNFRVKIAGRGPLETQLRESIRALSLGDCVELMGFIEEERLIRAYQAADVTILPTQSLEGFGTIISESLACGTPVIVTPVGGMPEAVAPLAAGLITRTASPEDIAERLASVLTGSLRLPDVDECRTYALERYDWRVVWASIRQIFLEHRFAIHE